MGLSSIPKKVYLFFLLPLFLFLLLSGTIWIVYMLNALGLGPAPLYEEYPNSLWTSKDPSITMMVPASAFERDDSFVELEGETKPISIFISEKDDTVLIRTISLTGEPGVDLLQGDHVKIRGSLISFRVIWDNLFDGRYSTITLERQN